MRSPLLLTAFLAVGGGAPRLACGYLVFASVVSVPATWRIRGTDLHLTTGAKPAACAPAAGGPEAGGTEAGGPGAGGQDERVRLVAGS
ncbi:hypothetical protein ABT026_20755 [Streptomyces sp. NPDC002734]|uniref:hypothetical protein n=1 Tax=Streptomyces sp. NPDC002734 TaxID=3154426 RepID=UPI00332271C5